MGTTWVEGAKAVVQLGFSVVVAGVLLWFLLTRFETTMDAITSRMAANTAVAEALVNTQKLEIDELHAQTEVLRKILSEQERQRGQ